MSETSLVLSNGIVALATIRREGGGFLVEVVAQRDDHTEEYDREYANSVVAYEAAAATHSLLDLSPPLTGAEKYMDEILLLTESGTRPPHGVVKLTGGTGSEWTIVWTSAAWLPGQIVLQAADGRTVKLVVPL